MSEILPKYKQIKYVLKNESDKFIVINHEYKNYDDSSYVHIDSTLDFEVYGIPSEVKNEKDKYKQELFEYNKNAKGVFDKLRLYETKQYLCSSEALDIHLQNEKELEPTRTSKDQLSFKVINYLGKSAFCFEENSKSYSIPFEVIPLKIDYEDDYVQLTDDIAEKCSQLLLDYSSPTNLNFVHNPEKTKKSPLEMFIFIRKFCSSQNIEYLMQSIKNNPDRTLITEEELKPFGSAPVSRKFFSNPFSNSKNWHLQDNNEYIPEFVMTSHKYDSLNTPANQFLKFAFNTFISVCQYVIDSIDKNYSYKDEAIYLKQSLENILFDPFFDDVKELSSMPFNNQVLQKREGYSQIFNAFNMLDIAQQLDWEGQKKVYEGQARNIALLYEYWLVFKLIDILKNLGAEFDLDISKDTSVDHMLSIKNGLLISLKEGKTSLLSAVIRDKNTKIKFYYNKTFSYKGFEGTDYQGSYSRDFRPDYTLSIFPANLNENQAIKMGEVSFVHFDAKYRVTDITSLFGKEKKDVIEEIRKQSEQQNSLKTDEELENEYFNLQKKFETINTYNRGDLLKMHTYNDAIRRTIGSYVLYPGSTDKKNDFKIYDELLPGVGAFAIRPGDKEKNGEKAITQFIMDVIDFKAKPSSRQYRKEYFENMVIQSPSEFNATGENIPSNKEFQMIGFIRNEYLDFLRDNHYIPSSLEEFESKKDFEFYFYFYAIKNSKVYTIHKETSKTKYLRVTTADIKHCKVEHGYEFQNLEPWEAEVDTIELVSKSALKERLDKLYVAKNFIPKNGFNADYYYIVKAKVTRYLKTGITAVSIGENEDISVYSPKIIQRIVGKDSILSN